MRIIAFAVCLAASYVWRRQTTGRAYESRTFPAVLCLLLTLVLLIWVTEIAYAWAGLWHIGLLDVVPFDACVVGLLMGYIAADRSDAAHTDPSDTPAASTSTVDRFFVLFRGGATAVGLGVLVGAAIVGPAALTKLIERIQGVKAGSVEFTLAAARNVDLTGDIHKAAAPRPANSTASDKVSERIGFIPVRLSMMQYYTLPPAAGKITKVPDTVRGEPEAFILSDIDDAITPTNPLAVRQVERDRALAWKFNIIKLKRTPSVVEDRSISTDWISKLGAGQERLLSGLAPHIRCLSAVVRVTQDRRLLQYQNFRIVQDLFLLAHLWTNAERDVALGKPLYEGTKFHDSAAFRESPLPEEMSGQDVSSLSLSANIAFRLYRLAAEFESFGRWAEGVLKTWDKQALPEDTRTTALGSCHDTEAPGKAIRDFADEIDSGGIAPVVNDGWFSPYLSILAAEALSALGDHASAVELLVQWLTDLDRATEAAGRPHHPQMADWYRLEVLDAVLTLQRLSEGSDISIPQTVSGLRAMATTYFPSVLARLDESPDLPIWSENHTTPSCTSDSEFWKQTIIFSYATWIKQYLDVMIRRAEPTSQNDLQLADLLEKINMDCFEKVLRAPPLEAHFNRAEQHLQFMITATSIRIDHLSRGYAEITADEWQAQRESAELSLHSAVNEFEHMRMDDKRDTYSVLIYGVLGADLITNARNQEEKLVSLPKP